MASPELVTKLTAYVSPGANSVSAADAAFIEDCLDEAIALVDNLCGTAIDRVPMVVLHRAYISTGSELYNQRSAPQGISQFAAPDGSAMRVRTDPLVPARVILTPFLPGGFA